MSCARFQASYTKCYDQVQIFRHLTLGIWCQIFYPLHRVYLNKVSVAYIIVLSVHGAAPLTVVLSASSASSYTTHFLCNNSLRLHSPHYINASTKSHHPAFAISRCLTKSSKSVLDKITHAPSGMSKKYRSSMRKECVLLVLMLWMNQ